MTSRASSLERSVGFIHSKLTTILIKVNIFFLKLYNYESCGKKVLKYTPYMFSIIQSEENGELQGLSFIVISVLSPGLYINILCESSFQWLNKKTSQERTTSILALQIFVSLVQIAR